MSELLYQTVARLVGYSRASGTGWKAAYLAACFDTDLRKTAFWEGSLKTIEGQLDRYVAL